MSDKSVAKKRYSVGDVVAQEMPFVHVLDGDQKSFKCDNCLKSEPQLKRCSKCMKMFYCNQKCQKSDWVWHKHECKLYSLQFTANNNNNSLLNDYLCRLLLRLWLLLQNRNDLWLKKCVVFNGSERCMADLLSHESDVARDEHRMQQFDEFCKVYTELGVGYDRERLFTLYGQLLINSMSIVLHELSYDNVKSGYGLYVCSSVFDHSCQPNACVLFDGIQVQVKAIRDIGAGEPVFIHYIPLDTCRTERRLRLRVQYYFDCFCGKCLAEESDNSMDYKRFKDLQNSLHSCIQSEMESRNGSFRQLDQLLAMSEHIYGAIHPELAALLMVGLQYRLICAQTDGSARELSAFIARVGRVIGLSFGTNHKFYKMFKMFVALKDMK